MIMNITRKVSRFSCESFSYVTCQKRAILIASFDSVLSQLNSTTSLDSLHLPNKTEFTVSKTPK